jgi:hypothetical protein
MNGGIQSVEEAFDRLPDGAVREIRPEGGGGPIRCVIRRHATWQTVRIEWKNRRWPPGDLPAYAVTWNGTLWLPAYGDGDVSVWPGIVSEHMRRVLAAEVGRQHAAVFAVQTTHEIVGTLKVPGGHRAEPLTLEVCPNDDATAYSSEPLCNYMRPCRYNAEHRRTPGHVVGEFHSHPPPSAEGYIRPHSDSDLYQLALAAAQGVHAYSVVLSAEGDYHAHATRAAGRRLMDDLRVFYADHRQSDARKERALGECRQPTAELIVRARTPYLWSLLVGSAEFYFDLMEHYDVRNKTPFIAAYASWVWENLRIRIHFVPAT